MADSARGDSRTGAGRFAVPCASWVCEVVAVDPSSQMLARLRERAEQVGADNFTCVQATWPEAEVGMDADVALYSVALNSYVLPLIEDVVPFLRRVDEVASARMLVVLTGTTPGILQEPFWRYFHHRQTPPAPTYLDALEILGDLGIDASVEVFEMPSTSAYADLDDAVDEYRSQLFLAGDRDTELRALLADWLVEDEAGWRAPFTTTPVALLSWVPVPADRIPTETGGAFTSRDRSRRRCGRGDGR